MKNKTSRYFLTRIDKQFLTHLFSEDEHYLLKPCIKTSLYISPLCLSTQAGFNAGDGIRYFSIPNSRTSEIISISSTSNYQDPGLWIFQVDGETVKDAGCTSSGGMSISDILTSP